MESIYDSAKAFANGLDSYEAQELIEAYSTGAKDALEEIESFFTSDTNDICVLLNIKQRVRQLLNK
jgi:hypothetical protein